MDTMPFSQACENNKGPILEQLRHCFAGASEVLEIGSGTGQHACWFAAHLPELNWQPSETAEGLPGLALRCAAYEGSNLLPPLALDVCLHPWPAPVHDAVFSANTLHIMPMAAVEQLFAELGRRSGPGTRLCIYGPFKYAGRYTSESNAGFDEWLKARDPGSGIRDFEAIDALAAAAGFLLRGDVAMPANNRLLNWQRA